MSYIDINPQDIKNEAKRDFVIWLDYILENICDMSGRQNDVIAMRLLLNKSFVEIGKATELTGDAVERIFNIAMEKINKSPEGVAKILKLNEWLQKENEELRDRLDKIRKLLPGANEALGATDEMRDIEMALKMRIDELHISNRTKMALYKNEISTVEEIVNLGMLRIARIRKLGRQGVTDINNELRRLGLLKNE